MWPFGNRRNTESAGAIPTTAAGTANSPAVNGPGVTRNPQQATRPPQAQTSQPPRPALKPLPAPPSRPHSSGAPLGIGQTELQSLLVAVLDVIEKWRVENHLPPVPPGVLLGQLNSILQARNVALNLDEQGQPWQRS